MGKEENLKDDNGEAIFYIINELKKGRKDLQKIKREAALKFKVGIIRNSEIICYLKKVHGKIAAEMLELLRKKPVRTLSGITTVALMIKPDGSCTRGCIYCPYTGKAAKSYTGEEPAAMRARNAGFDPVKQIDMRLRQYEETGHLNEKCEVVVMGGTFLEMPSEYKMSFIRSIYDAMNGYATDKHAVKTIDEAKKRNEKSAHRVIGLTIETRPDVCGKKQINEMLGYGATRVELGVQHPDDLIYARINRGHTVNDVVEATALLKDSAFKVLYHIMPGLPGSNKKKDIAILGKIFDDERFRPDMLKIYPTLAIAGTRLYEMMKEGGYKPYEAEEAADLIAEMFRYIPKYARVMRIQRDIPANLISAGVKKSNLRELVQQKIIEKGIKPLEIRSREIGFAKRKTTGNEIEKRMMDIETLEYEASGGKEYFISYENDEMIAGFIRLRIPGRSAFREEITKAAGLVRELHVYGSEEKIGRTGKIQHSGIGKMLLEEAEEIAKQDGMDKMVIISGVGAKGYYRKFRYKDDGPYVSKGLR